MRRRRTRRRRKIYSGRGVTRPYVNKRNRLMLGSGIKQKGGFFAIAALASSLAPVAGDILSKVFR